LIPTVQEAISNSLNFLDGLLHFDLGTASATRLDEDPAYPRSMGVNSGLPSMYIWEEPLRTLTQVPDNENYVQKGILINRALIQILRDMKN